MGVSHKTVSLQQKQTHILEMEELAEISIETARTWSRRKQFYGFLEKGYRNIEG